MRDKIKRLINKFFETVLRLDVCYIEYNKILVKSHFTKNLNTGLNLAKTCNHSVVKGLLPIQKSTEILFVYFIWS